MPASDSNEEKDSSKSDSEASLNSFQADQDGSEEARGSTGTGAGISTTQPDNLLLPKGKRRDTFLRRTKTVARKVSRCTCAMVR